MQHVHQTLFGTHVDKSFLEGSSVSTHGVPYAHTSSVGDTKMHGVFPMNILMLRVPRLSIVGFGTVESVTWSLIGCSVLVFQLALGLFPLFALLGTYLAAQSARALHH